MPQILGNYLHSYENPHATIHVFVCIVHSSKSPAEPLVFLISSTKEFCTLMHYNALKLYIKVFLFISLKFQSCSQSLKQQLFILHRVKFLNISLLLKMSILFLTSFLLYFKSRLNDAFFFWSYRHNFKKHFRKSFGVVCIFVNPFFWTFFLFCTSLITKHTTLHQKT